MVDEETGEFSFTRGEDTPLDCDVLVVDEMSMVDCRLMRSLLKAARDTTRLLLVGDPYQLPSVGPGAVLRDLLRAGVPAFELKQIKRNAGDIVRACHAIKDGRSPREFSCSKLDLDAGHNWRHVEVSGPAHIRDVIERLIAEILPAMGLNTTWDVQTVSPVNDKGELSGEAVNKMLRPVLNPAFKPEEKLAIAVGDKVLRTKNGKVKGEMVGGDGGAGAAVAVGGEIQVVNGDIGIIREINKRSVVVEFRYPDRIATLKRSEHELKLAYCLTCHKLQGSECQVVILPIHQSFARMPMVTREWIYTAMSRAKLFLVTVGDLEAIDRIVPRVGMDMRQTALRGMLEGLRCK
jgi:exodeoxyribonuclease V alpha subunit